MLSSSFTVRSVDERFATALRWHCAPFIRPTGEQHAFFVDLLKEDEDSNLPEPSLSLYEAGVLRFRHPRVERVLEHAVWSLHNAVPKRSRDFLFLHAGVVARGGEAILLPGAMEVGKSSLVVALLELGFGYLSDELGAIDPITGRLHAFPKLISLDDEALLRLDGLEDRLVDRSGSMIALPQRFIRPQDVGSAVADPAPARWIVFLGDDRAGPPRLEPISRAEAVERMAANCFNMFRYHERGVVLLSRVARSAQPFELRGGSPRERAALLDGRLI
jgi:hypothetical protein